MEKIKCKTKFLILFIFFLSQSYSQTIHKTVNLPLESKTVNPKNAIIAKVQDLSIPTMIYPSNGSINIPIIPVFSFISVNGADRYDIELSFDPYFSQIIIDSYLRFASPTNANDTLSFAPGINSPNNFTGSTTYYWRVQAIMNDGSNSSPWSQPIIYTTESSGLPISQPNLIIPYYGSTISWINVPLVWSIVSGTTNYQVQYSTDANFNGFTYWYTYGTQSSINTSIKPFQTYYWRVIGINENSLSQFSTTNLFYTGNQAVLNQDQDTYDDGSGLDNYDNNLDLYWLIHPNDAKQIVLSFSSFNTEQDYDFVTIYDGPTTEYPVLGKFSGNTIPDSVISSSNNMLVRFTTDAGVNYSGWNANYYSLLGNKLYPILTISSGSVSAGDVISASSQNMSPNGVVNFTLSGPDTSFVSSVLADYQGNALTSFTIPQDAVVGIYEINATDVTSSRSSPSKYFNVSSIPITSNMGWVSFLQDTVISGEQISLQWNDHMILNPNYSITGATRGYSYSVELSSDGGITWKTIKTIDGGGRINEWVIISTNISMSNSGNYKIQIVDNKVTSRFIISNAFTVISPPANNINVTLAWDHNSNPTLTKPPPIGIAADGVSRLYLIVSSTKNASQIQVTLSDNDGNSDVKTLGKVMDATVTDQYSNEANSASSLTATETIPNYDNKYWFWYVAPDNFVGINSSDSTNIQRIVSANINVVFNDGTNLSEVKYIKIVRPPLLLIHGLGDYGTTWDNFGYDNKGAKQLFINDKRFTIRFAPSITNNSGFDIGGKAVEYQCYKLIDSMRSSGYADNQVLYVGHSMGGNYLRAFVSDASYLANSNYNNGYINRAILLDSPNNGAPFADLVSDILNYIGIYNFLDTSFFNIINGLYMVNPSAFIKSPWEGLFSVNNFGPLLLSLNPTKALLDLKTIQKGGYKLNQSNISAHLIGGTLLPISTGLDQVPSDYWNSISQNIPGFVIFDYFSDILQVLHPNARKATQGMTNNSEKALVVWDNVIHDQYGFSLLFDSDLIVPLESQLGGLSQNASNVTVFNNIIHSGNSQLAVTSNPNVGSSVEQLLNSDINSPQFGSIPYNNVTAKISAFDNNRQKLPILFGIKKNDLKITSIPDSVNVSVDSILNISFNIQDTVGLEYVKLFFQDKSYLSYDKSFNQGFTVQVSGTYLDTQPIEILAVYYNNDSTYWSYISSNVNVQTTSSLQKFFIEPKVIEIASNQLYSPDYNAVYSSFLSKIQSNNPDLKFNVSDPNIVSLSPGSNFIKGISKGETSVIISYKGLADTLYIVVDDSITTGINETKKDKTIPVNFYLSQNYPNPFNPKTFIEFSVPHSELVKLKVYDILGREIKALVNEIIQAGNYRVEFNARNIASGVYFYQLRAGDFISTKKMLLIK